MSEIDLIRNIVERDTAKQFCLQVIRDVRSLPEAERLNAATTLLHKMLLEEMLAYKDRLNAACKSVLSDAMKEATA